MVGAADSALSDLKAGVGVGVSEFDGLAGVANEASPLTPRSRAATSNNRQLDTEHSAVTVVAVAAAVWLGLALSLLGSVPDGTCDGEYEEHEQSMCWICSFVGVLCAAGSFVAGTILLLSLTLSHKLKNDQNAADDFWADSAHNNWRNSSILATIAVLPILLMIQTAAWSFLIATDKK